MEEVDLLVIYHNNILVVLKFIKVGPSVDFDLW